MADLVPRRVVPGVVVGMIIGVPTLRRADLLARLVASIDHPVEHLVIVDNGRQNLDHIHTPPEVERVTVTRTAGNLGVAGSWNLIIKSTPFAPWWLVVNDDAWFPPGVLAQIVEHARTDAVCLSAASPPWACFTIGEDVIRMVGLFDERFHPAYFEDTDYVRRCKALGVPIVQTDVPVHHDNSSTIKVDGAGNGRTFGQNLRWFQERERTGDNTDGWDLDRRRQLGWE